MNIKHRSPLKRRRLQAFALAAALSLSTSAWCIESAPPASYASFSAPASPEQTAAPSGTMARLHQLAESASDFTSRASELAMGAMEMIGIRYQYGGNSPESGMDCSGLVRYVFKETWGKILPRTSAEISHAGAKVNKEELRPGDLVFFNTLRKTFSHVGIYLGDNKFIHSQAAGKEVRIESMDLSYWKKRFNGARRISDPDDQ
ncbi:MAG: C40 family peptidase [Janthinobacterium lividum]